MTRVARVGSAGLPLGEAGTLDPKAFGESVRAGYRQYSRDERVELDKRILLSAEFGEAGLPEDIRGTVLDRVRSALEVTLALRCRIFRGAKSAEEAVTAARRHLESRWPSFFHPKRGGNLKFENRDSDTY